MNNITFKELVFDEQQILNLYLDNKWYNFTNNKEKLFQGIKQSLDVIAAYDGETLVGLIRVIGDRTTIVYIQDILVLTTYQRQKIGTTLTKMILVKYKDCLHINLSTDQSIKTIQFYKSLGFAPYPELEMICFKHIKSKKE